MRKGFLVILLAFCTLILFSLTSAQVKKAPAKGEEHHHLLTVSLKNASEHAKALAHYATVNKELKKEIAKEHGDAIGKYLEAAKKHLTAIEEKMTEATEESCGDEPERAGYSLNQCQHALHRADSGAGKRNTGSGDDQSTCYRRLH